MARQDIEIICGTCEVSFFNKSRRKSVSKFCSIECLTVARRKNSTTNCHCGNCGKIVSKKTKELRESKSGKVFCSQSCSTSYANKQSPKRLKIERVCRRCPNKFTPKPKSRRVLCDSCQSLVKSSAEYKSCTLGEYTSKVSVAGKHPSWIHSHIRAFNRAWNKNLLKIPCQKCNYFIHIELAHIKAVSSYPNDTLLGVINHPDNILVLCRNCHWEFDHRHLSLENIPKRS